MSYNDRTKTQNEQIADDLMKGKVITPMDALMNYGSLRLAARIFELRQEGMDIDTLNITDHNKTYAAYMLASDNNTEYAV
jgi:hypothetical protein